MRIAHPSSALWQQLLPHPVRLIGGALLAVLTMLAGMALLGLSGWFITATALAGLQASSAVVFDVFGPSAGIRLLASLNSSALLKALEAVPSIKTGRPKQDSSAAAPKASARKSKA